MVLRKLTPSGFQSRRKFPRWLKVFRYWQARLLRLRGQPRATARGLAVGIFAGFFPFFGLQIALAVFLAVLFRGNKLAAAAATWVSNPLTYVPIYAFNYTVGGLLLGERRPLAGGENFQARWQSGSSWMEWGSSFAVELLVGCFVVGLIAALCTYFLSLKAIPRWRRGRGSQV